MILLTLRWVELSITTSHTKSEIILFVTFEWSLGVSYCINFNAIGMAVQIINTISVSFYKNHTKSLQKVARMNADFAMLWERSCMVD